MFFPRMKAVLVAASVLGAMLSSATFASSINPLLDFQSAELTEQFRNNFDGTSGATVNVDVPYGLDEAQKYDVYLPEQRSNAPILIMVHGGNWAQGDKLDGGLAEAKAAYWVKKGFVFVSVNYRLLPRKDPLVQAADVALAIANVQKSAANWNADKSRIVLMGYGAGAHLTALLSSNPSLAADQGASPWKGAVVLDTPALNIPAIMADNPSQTYTAAFGSSVEFWEDSSPTHLVDNSGLPMLVVCAAESSDDTCGKAKAFKQAADNAGIPITVLPQSFSPADINRQLGVQASYSQQVDDFIQALL